MPYKSLSSIGTTVLPSTLRWIPLCVVAAAGGVIGCGGEDISCGAGTVKSGNQCVVADASDAGPGTDGGADSQPTGSGGATSMQDSGAAPDAGSMDAGDAGDPTIPSIDFEGALAAAPAAADSILLTWSPATYSAREDAVFRYEVFAALESGDQNFGEPLLVSAPGALSAVIEGLSDEEHFFVVRAVVDGSSRALDENTVEVSATPQVDDEAPTFDGATDTEPAGAGAVRVSWDAAEDNLTPAGAMSYQVFWSAVSGQAVAGALGAISAPGANSAIVTDLPEADADYFFHVRAIDAAGNQDDNEAEAEGTSGPDSTGPLFSGCAGIAERTAAGAIVSWEPAADDITPPENIVYNVYAFEVPVDEDTSFDEPAATFTGVTVGEVGGLLQGTDYRLVCRAADATGNEDQNVAVRQFKTLDDGTPPVFAGVADAVIGSVEVELGWSLATDDQTDESDIVYNIYAAAESGMQDFDAPPLDVSLPGASGHLLRGLTSNRPYYFVVRARDAARNEDDNVVEFFAETLVSFAQDVQPILTANCALSGCHIPGTPPQGQILSEGFAYASIVDVVAKEGTAVGDAELKRVDSTSSDPLDSYMYRKITGEGQINGSLMPPTSSNRVLTEAQKESIRLWIVQGALNN